MKSHGTPEPTATEIGGELIHLLTETAATTGLGIHVVSNSISDATGVQFEVRDGRLTITESALLAIGQKMAHARARCRTLEMPHIPPPSPPAKPRAVVKPIAQVQEEVDPHHIPWGWTFVVIVAIAATILVAWGSSRTPIQRSNKALERAEYKARHGMATEMSQRETEEFRKKQETDAAQHRAYVNALTEARQSRYSDRDHEIYRYMRRRFESLGSTYNPSIHDDVIAGEAAVRFGVPANEATSIYIRVDAK